MRLRIVLAACLLLTLAAHAAAQMPGPAYTFSEVQGPAAAQAAGSTVTYNFTAERACSNQAQYLPPTVAEVAFFAEDANLTVAGPGQVEFPEQVCAQMGRVVVAFPATVAIPADQAPKVYKLKALLHPGYTSLAPYYSSDATVEFLLAVAAPAEATVDAASDGDVRASPAPAPVFLLGLLALAALAMRRSE